KMIFRLQCFIDKGNFPEIDFKPEIVISTEKSHLCDSFILFRHVVAANLRKNLQCHVRPRYRIVLYGPLARYSAFIGCHVNKRFCNMPFGQITDTCSAFVCIASAKVAIWPWRKRMEEISLVALSSVCCDDHLISVVRRK